MARRDVLLLMAMAVVWGVNFAVIKTGLRSVPPFFLVFLRYLFVVLPLIFFVRKPAVSWRTMVAYALLSGVGQFAFLFYSLKIGMPAGLASVVMQSQTIFTLVLSAWFMGERIGGAQLAGIGLAAVGLGLIAGPFGAAAVPKTAFLMNLLAAFCWSCSNLIVKRASEESLRNGRPLGMMEMIVWSAIFVPFPMLGLSLVGDGPDAILQSLTQIDAAAVLSVLYLVILSTFFAYYVMESDDRYVLRRKGRPLLAPRTRHGAAGRDAVPQGAGGLPAVGGHSGRHRRPGRLPAWRIPAENPLIQFPNQS